MGGSIREMPEFCRWRYRGTLWLSETGARRQSAARVVMDVRQLRNFVAIVDSGSVSKAADRLHIAQPSLSAQLRGLEEEAGRVEMDKQE